MLRPREPSGQYNVIEKTFLYRSFDQSVTIAQSVRTHQIAKKPSNYCCSNYIYATIFVVLANG